MFLIRQCQVRGPESVGNTQPLSLPVRLFGRRFRSLALPPARLLLFLSPGSWRFLARILPYAYIPTENVPHIEHEFTKERLHFATDSIVKRDSGYYSFTRVPIFWMHQSVLGALS